MVDTFSHQEDIHYLVHRGASSGSGGTERGSAGGTAALCVEVVVEFPLLDKSRLSVPELEYLVQFMTASCPPVTVMLSSSDLSLSSSFNTKPSLHFPKQHLPNLRHIHLPNWDSNSTLYDFLPAVEQTIADTWGTRKRFVTELQQISSVVEFDPVDFSYVSLSLRLTRNKHFILSIVDLRIPPHFPSAPILLLMHDLLSGASYPLENKNTISSSTFFSAEWTGERMAREYFVCLCAEIEAMAFGANGGANKNNSY
jgi:hypothetical protein